MIYEDVLVSFNVENLSQTSRKTPTKKNKEVRRTWYFFDIFFLYSIYNQLPSNSNRMLIFFFLCRISSEHPQKIGSYNLAPQLILL